MSDFKSLLDAIRDAVREDISGDDKLRRVCKLLRDSVPHYDWVGIYRLRGEELILGPFVGEPTEHVRINIGQGICGQAAAVGNAFVVQDVSKESNYLSCSPAVKSEIVVPVFRSGKMVGEIDIDSHSLAPFSDADRKFLEAVAEIIAPYV